MTLSRRFSPYSRLAMPTLAFAASVFSTQVLGSALPPIEKIKCQDKLSDTLKTWDSAEDWRRQADPVFNGRAFRTPTHKIGTWIEVQTSPSGLPEAYRTSSAEILHFSWDEKCAPSVETRAFNIPKDEKVFTDADLEKLLKSGKAGAIYVWYPGFDFSYMAYDEFKKAAAARHLDVTVVLGVEANAEEIAQREKTFKLHLDDRRLESVELLNRNLTLHFPNSIVYANGKLAKVNGLGAMDAKLYGSYMDEQLKALKGSK